MLNGMRLLILLLAGMAWGTGQVPAVEREAPPRNVLLIAVDDLRPELGCLGVAHARTPNIDRLAAEGMMFTRHFVQVPTCGASRYSLLTGRSPARSGARRGNASFHQGKTALSSAELEGSESGPH